MRQARWVAGGAALLLAAGVPLAAGAATATGEPVVTTSQSAHDVGGTVDVALSGWPSGVVTLALCGQRAQAGSADCALDASTTVNVDASGIGSGRLTAVEPAAGCPCVIRATTLSADIVATTDVRLNGVVDRVREQPTAPAEPEPTQPPLAAQVKVERDTAASSAARRLVGVASPLVLTITVVNPGTAPTPPQRLQVVAGRNITGGSTLAEINIAALEPGETTVIPARVEVGAPAIGRYVLHGRVEGAPPGDAPLFDRRVESWPIVTIAALVMVVCLATTRGRERRLASASVGTIAIVTFLAAGHALTS